MCSSMHTVLWLLIMQYICTYSKCKWKQENILNKAIISNLPVNKEPTYEYSKMSAATLLNVYNYSKHVVFSYIKICIHTFLYDYYRYTYMNCEKTEKKWYKSQD